MIERRRCSHVVVSPVQQMPLINVDLPNPGCDIPSSSGNLGVRDGRKSALMPVRDASHELKLKIEAPLSRYSVVSTLSSTDSGVDIAGSTTHFGRSSSKVDRHYGNGAMYYTRHRRARCPVTQKSDAGDPVTRLGNVTAQLTKKVGTCLSEIKARVRR